MANVSHPISSPIHLTMRPSANPA
ncbi:hypothetical protein CCACVL1_20115 [Corchorus capsularis]|uniref:Uncharacterized protein n=1 Tax=Corchorus capsularis TaxID=210143 RepID=A0A1R3HCF1_COCAP|nr:hypothetical protein CCACVL1_20115 [Corchorus capsularis]